MSHVPETDPLPARSGVPTAVPARPASGLRHGMFWALGLVAVVTMLALVGVPVALGGRLGTATIVGCAVLAMSAAALFVLPGRVGRAVTAPDRLTVTGDRVELVLRSGTGRQWRRADGELVRLTGTGRATRLTVGGDPDGVGWTQLRHFDLAAVRAACLAHGWSWQEGGGQVLAPVAPAVAARYPEPATDPPLEPELTLLLRDGLDAFPRRVRYVTGGLFGLWLLVLIAVGLWVIMDADHLVSSWLLPAASPVLLLVAAGYAVVVTRRLKISLTVRVDEVALRYGANTTVAKRDAVARVTRRGRRVVFHGLVPHTRVLWLDAPADPEAVMTGLTRFGWPVESD